MLQTACLDQTAWRALPCVSPGSASRWTVRRPSHALNVTGLHLHVETPSNTGAYRKQTSVLKCNIACLGLDTTTSSSSSIASSGETAVTSPDLTLQCPSGTVISVFGVQHLGREPHIGEVLASTVACHQRGEGSHGECQIAGCAFC